MVSPGVAHRRTMTNTTTAVTTTLSLPDERTVAVDVSGPADGPAVVVMHVAPGSRRFDPGPAVTAAAGVRLITIDRPGYGGSDPLPPGAVPTITQFADDAGAVLDQLGITDVAVVGWSAGGRVAAALAARRPQLVRALVLVGTPAPDGDVPWFPDEQRPFIEFMKSDPAGCVPALVEQLAEMSKAPGTALVSSGESDAAALAADEALGAAVNAMVAEGFAQGPIGLALDLVSYTAVDWGFDPVAIGAPTVCAYGADDEVVTPAHCAWWASRIPGAEAWEVPSTGHLVLGPIWARVLEHTYPDHWARPA